VRAILGMASALQNASTVALIVTFFFAMNNTFAKISEM
jgi:hypothetical protein